MTRRRMLAVTGAMVLAAQRKARAQGGVMPLILHYGQSNAGGVTDSPAVLTTSQPSGYSNYTLGPVNGVVGAGEYELPLIGRTEVEWGTEHLASGVAHQLTYMAGGGTNYQSVTFTQYEDGAAYSALCRIPSSPALPITGNSSYQEFTNTQIPNAISGASSLGLTGKAVAMTWTHGEADQGAGTTATTYEADMVQLQKDITFDCQAATGQTNQVLLFIDQLGNVYSVTSGCGVGIYNTMGLVCSSLVDGPGIGMWWAARDNPGKIFMSGPKYHMEWGASGLHLSPTGHRHNGMQHGKALYRVLVLGMAVPCIAPRSLTRSGVNITAQFWLPTSSLVVDTTTVPGKPGYGFEYWNDTMALSSPIIPTIDNVAGDTVTMHLASVPTGFTVEHLRYGWWGPTGGNGFPGGNIRNNDPTLGVLSGVAIPDWLINFNEPMPFGWNPPNSGGGGSICAGISGSGVVIR